MAVLHVFETADSHCYISLSAALAAGIENLGVIGAFFPFKVCKSDFGIAAASPKQPARTVRWSHIIHLPKSLTPV